MGTISLEHSDRLYWLGRYTERFFTTLKALGDLYDKMIESKQWYKQYLENFGLADTYADSKLFMRSFIFDKSNPNSASFSLERAYDNGIVLREEISTVSLSYLQMAKDTLFKAEQSNNIRMSLLPLEDMLYSFWGSINEHIFDDEIRNIIYIGKTLERLDMYVRLKYPYDSVKKEFVRLRKNLDRVPQGTPYRYNAKYMSVLTEMLVSESDYEQNSVMATEALEHLFERSEVLV